tara:strand:+ start:359 stop:487 length:129 start_codon:yes stop_codon:yes gene_type:complete
VGQEIHHQLVHLKVIQVVMEEVLQLAQELLMHLHMEAGAEAE